jgi:hypothetical protein
LACPLKLIQRSTRTANPVYRRPTGRKLDRPTAPVHMPVPVKVKNITIK